MSGQDPLSALNQVLLSLAPHNLFSLLSGGQIGPWRDAPRPVLETVSAEPIQIIEGTPDAEKVIAERSTDVRKNLRTDQRVRVPVVDDTGQQVFDDLGRPLFTIERLPADGSVPSFTSLYSRHPTVGRRWSYGKTGSEETRKERSATKGLGSAYNDEFTPFEQEERVKEKGLAPGQSYQLGPYKNRPTAGFGSVRNYEHPRAVHNPYPSRVGTIQVETKPKKKAAMY